MNRNLEDMVAVVTGSTQGIGEGIARRLAAEGAAVTISGLAAERGELIARELRDAGGQALFIAGDLTDEATCAALIEETHRRYGRLDILVNNAAVFPCIPLEEMTAEQWDHVFAVNVRGAFLCCQYALPLLQRQGGSIINIGSSLVYRGLAERIAYACSKGALLTMTKVLARSYLQHHIRVNSLLVGWVITPGEIALRDQLRQGGAAYLEEQGRQAPLGRLETPEDIAAAVAYLVSDEASHVTGCELNLSGGLWV